MKDVLAATKSSTWKLAVKRAEIGGVVLEPGEFVLQLVPKEGITAAALSSNDVVLVLDTNVTPELQAEGTARDFVRLVQQARKEHRLHVSDRIELWVDGDAATTTLLKAHAHYVQEQVLATDLSFATAPAGTFTAAGKIGSDDREVRFGIRRA